MPDSRDVPARVRQLATQLAAPVPMRRGSLSERYVKCSKPGCPCATQPDARHGPYYSWTRTVAGRTHSRFLSAAQATQVRRQLAAGRQFRQQVEAYWAACEHWADGELLPVDTPAAAADEKRGSKRAGQPTSSRRSTP